MYVQDFNAAVCFGMACLCAYAMGNKQIRDGLVIKIGLFVLLLGFTATGLVWLEPVVLLSRMLPCLTVVNLGVVVVIAGVYFRLRTPELRKHFDALTGWPPLEKE